MKELIDKSALVAEIENRIKETESMQPKFDQFWAGQISAFKGILKILDTLAVKEVENDRKFECPNIKIKDAIEISSRMKYISEDLKPIAEFIMDYCSWNLHKNEWNQPTIEVPLFRVLDALTQRGKPYCCG